jgi:hypothetical protein
MDTGALSLGVKRQGREADHLPSASVEVKKMWFYIATPPYAFMALCLIVYAQGQLYFYLLQVIESQPSSQ